MPTGENDCPKNSTLTLVSAANENSTPVALDMSYSAESNSSSIEEFEEELVDEFIRTAVLAIFGCVPDATEKIAPNTLEIIDGKKFEDSIGVCPKHANLTIPFFPCYLDSNL